LLELSERVNHSLVICKNSGLFKKDGLWPKRTRACVETTVSLVCCASAQFAWFRDIVELLANIGTKVKIRELSLAGKDQLFVMRWTCLSLVAIRSDLENDWWWQRWVIQLRRRICLRTKMALATAKPWRVPGTLTGTLYRGSKKMSISVISCAAKDKRLDGRSKKRNHQRLRI